MSEKSKNREHQIYRVTLVGSIGNLILVIFKFISGILGHSAAMIADAVHSLSDFVTDIIVVLLVKISSKPNDIDHKYGHGKYETLATAIIGIILLCVGVGILWNGVKSIWYVINGGILPQPKMIALIAAVLSIVIKEILYRFTVIVGKRVNSQTIIANAWHHRSDAFSSIGTLLGIGGAILLGEKWSILDPIAAVVVSVFIIKVSIQLLKPALEELTDVSLPQSTEKEIEKILISYPDVVEPHNLRTRKIGNYSAVEVHIRMDGNLTVSQSHDMTKSLEQQISKLLGGNAYITIHVEPKK